MTKCRDSNSARRKYKASQLCDCGNQRTPGFKTCKKCRRKRRNYNRLKRATPEGMRKTLGYNRKSYYRLKELIFSVYGTSCKCCGEDKREFLTLDHLEPAGSRHHELRCGVGLFRWLKKHNFPAGYRTLCLNCNFAIGHYGYCPHHHKSVYEGLNLLSKYRKK